MRADPDMILDNDIRSRIDSFPRSNIDDGMRVGGSYLKVPRQHAITANRYGGTLAADEVAATNSGAGPNHNRIIVHLLHYQGCSYSAPWADFNTIPIAQQLHPDVDKGRSLTDNDPVVIPADYNLAVNKLFRAGQVHHVIKSGVLQIEPFHLRPRTI
ncbi:hypothetical protein CBM2587_B60393 [Cupriavidus taiwanensis]|uniref:Uncharacterized protein n=1 Tax=Cupriavidus taiwanensis TaxID=164546 RepID=A0A375C660_9BURK|nr:hypothetical protein CBM2587_B60393 [Cupriavidus taiwanensis]